MSEYRTVGDSHRIAQALDDLLIKYPTRNAMRLLKMITDGETDNATDGRVCRRINKIMGER